MWYFFPVVTICLHIIQAKIDYLQSEEDKFNLAMKEFTPEQREERLRQIQETKERIFNK